MSEIKKTPIDFPERLGTLTFDFHGKPVEVKPYVSEEDEQLLISVYVDAYFDEGSFGNDTDFFGAERWLDFALLDILTSVNPSLKKWNSGEDNKILEYANESGLLHEVKSRIVNFEDVYDKIQRIVSDGRQERFSANGLLKEAIKLITDLDFEKVKTMMSQVKDLEGEMEDSPLSALFKESKEG